MRSKKVKNGAIIGVILLLILLLALGIGVYVFKNKKTPSEKVDTEPEVMTFIQEKDETADLAQEEFEDETTGKAESTQATQKGGSETFGIVPPAEEEEDKDVESAETNWLGGVW